MTINNPFNVDLNEKEWFVQREIEVHDGSYETGVVLGWLNKCPSIDNCLVMPAHVIMILCSIIVVYSAKLASLNKKIQANFDSPSNEFKQFKTNLPKQISDINSFLITETRLPKSYLEDENHTYLVSDTFKLLGSNMSALTEVLNFRMFNPFSSHALASVVFWLKRGDKIIHAIRCPICDKHYSDDFQIGQVSGIVNQLEDVKVDLLSNYFKAKPNFQVGPTDNKWQDWEIKK
jgi:hypothetical protein